MHGKGFSEASHGICSRLGTPLPLSDIDVDI